MQKTLMAIIVMGLFMMGGMFILSMNQQNKQVVSQPTENNINIQLDKGQSSPSAPVVVAPIVETRPRWHFGVWWRPAPPPPVSGSIDINVQRNVNVDKNVNKDIDKDINRGNHKGQGQGQ